jgi:hypothetical protein
MNQVVVYKTLEMGRSLLYDFLAGVVPPISLNDEPTLAMNNDCALIISYMVDGEENLLIFFLESSNA